MLEELPPFEWVWVQSISACDMLPLIQFVVPVVELCLPYLDAIKVIKKNTSSTKVVLVSEESAEVWMVFSESIVPREKTNVSY